MVSQGQDTNNLPITYLWYHIIPSNICHITKSWKHQKEGHQLNETYQDNMGGCTECCKIYDKGIGGNTGVSNNNKVKAIKLMFL